jgi:hypothetical protein
MFYKLLLLFLISSVKFIFAFPFALKYHFSFPLTLLVTSLGGIAGVLFFAFISAELLIFYHWFVHVYLAKFPRSHRFAKSVKEFYHKFFPRKKKKIFSKKSKRFVRIKQSYGLAGIAILTPFILSIPIGTFLAIRFFTRSKYTLLFLCLAVVFWSVVFSLIVHFTDLRF